MDDAAAHELSRRLGSILVVRVRVRNLVDGGVELQVDIFAPEPSGSVVAKAAHSALLGGVEDSVMTALRATRARRVVDAAEPRDQSSGNAGVVPVPPTPARGEPILTRTSDVSDGEQVSSVATSQSISAENTRSAEAASRLVSVDSRWVAAGVMGTGGFGVGVQLRHLRQAASVRADLPGPLWLGVDFGLAYAWSARIGGLSDALSLPAAATAGWSFDFDASWIMPRAGVAAALIYSFSDFAWSVDVGVAATAGVAASLMLSAETELVVALDAVIGTSESFLLAVGVRL